MDLEKPAPKPAPKPASKPEAPKKLNKSVLRPMPPGNQMAVTLSKSSLIARGSQLVRPKEYSSGRFVLMALRI